MKRADLKLTEISPDQESAPRFYRELASWWPLLSAPEDHAKEAEFYREVIEADCEVELRTVLELGSGGGNSASHLKRHYEMTLVDPSPEMLEVSRALNPDCEHVEGDMRTLRLEREFDGVFIQDSIVYMLTEEDLRRALETAFIHCRPGGIALFAPDFVRELFQASTDHGGHDDSERGLRYLEWTWDPDPSDSTYTVDYAFLLRERDGSMKVFHDRHIEGLFSLDTWMRLIEEVGFEPHCVPFSHSEVEEGTHALFVGHKPTRQR